MANENSRWLVPNFHGSDVWVLGRVEDSRRVTRLLREFPVVALIGPRQVGKTTLAHAIADGVTKGVHRFDLERSEDLAQLEDPMLALESLRGLVVLDEIQRRPELFPTLRVLADLAFSGFRDRREQVAQIVPTHPLPASSGLRVSQPLRAARMRVSMHEEDDDAGFGCQADD
jgi:AAA domain